MAAAADGGDDVRRADTDTKKPRRRLEDIVSIQLLEALAESSAEPGGKGFRFRPAPELETLAKTQGQFRVGYTDMKTGVIYYNPLVIEGFPAMGIEPWSPGQGRGFATHEAGHHAPPVRELDDTLVEHLKDPDIIPADYAGDPEAETSFLSGLNSHLINALLDVWLESYMGREPYRVQAQDIKEMNVGMGESESYMGMSRPEQLLQILIRSRYIKQTKLAERVAPEVLESYERILQTPGMRRMMDRGVFEDYFASPKAKKDAIKKKDEAFSAIFLPEYLKLVKTELDKRAEQQQQESQGGDEGQESDQEGQPSNGKRKPSKKQGQGDPQSGQPSGVPSETVPLTKAEKQKLLEQLGKELQKAGEEQFGSEAPSTEEQQQLDQLMKALQKASQQRAEAKAKGEPVPVEEPKADDTETDPLQAARDLARKLNRESRHREQDELAQSLGVETADIREWQRIVAERRDEIQTLTQALTEIFVSDRRPITAYLKREGEIVPGLEYETIAGLVGGKDDPQTRMRIERNKEFMETEIEFIGDVSGSMTSGGKDQMSIDMMVVILESMQNVRKQLEAEGLLGSPGEQPLRVGATKFDTRAERVTTLDEPLSPQKELRIVHEFKANGGGTDERQAIEQVYQGLSLRKKNVIKLMVVFTDGQGSGAAIAPIIEKIEDDKEVLFLALGLGDDAASSKAIADTYTAPLRDRETNVFAEAVSDPKQMTPLLVEFLRREITKRKPKYR